MKLLAVYTTVAKREDADRLATAAVENQLAACVQLAAVDSIYSWNGAFQRDPEVRVMFKTTEGRYDDLQKLILELHPYDLPAVYAVEIACADSAYEAWVLENTAGDCKGQSEVHLGKSQR